MPPQKDTDDVSAETVDDVASLMLLTPQNTPEPTEPEPPAPNATEEPKESDAKPAWDKDRQRRDQQRAEKLEKLETTQASLAQQIESLPTQISNQVLEQVLSHISSPASQTKAEEKDDLDALIEAIDNLDDESDADELVGTMRDMAKTVKGRDSLIGSLRDQIAAQAAAISEQQRQAQIRNQRDAARESTQRINSVLDSLDKRHAGGRSAMRAEALQMAQQSLRDSGFDAKEYLPPESTAIYAIKLAYATLAAQDSKRTPAAGSSPTLDTLHGGKTADGLPRGGLRDVVADMRSKGTL